MDINGQIDEEIEIILLINFSKNEVSNLPHNVHSILNGKYEDILNNEPAALKIKAINHNDNLEEAIHKSISETDIHLSWLCTGIASLLYFAQCNWTGPHMDKNVDCLTDRRDEALKNLSLHDECKINLKKSYLLYMSKKIFSSADLQLKYKSCIWWLFRTNLLHQQILDESSGIIFKENEKLILGINNLNILKDPLCNLLSCLEIAKFYLNYRRTQDSESYLEQAQSIAGLTLNLEGAMGKRTRFQQVAKAQLYLKVEMNKDIFPSIDCEDIPKSVDLNDELRLEHIEFSEHKEETQLGAVEEAIILTKYSELQSCQPKHKLTDEEIMPYLTKVIENTKNWSLKMTSLYYRCLLEQSHSRTSERCMRQVQSLIKEYSNEKASVARRMDLFFTSGIKPSWVLEEDMASLMRQLGLVKEALRVYTRLKLWEEVIICYCMLKMNDKAASVIQEELSKKQTVKLWCLLGDITEDVNHYETAWKLSKEKSSRAQRHWGFFYFRKKNYAKAVPHLKLSVELNNIQECVWLRLGYAALRIEDWKLAATAYRRYCAFEQYSCDAWNNLAKAYIKLGDKARAWKCLQDAVKCDYDRWEVWDNLMAVSIDLGHFSEVIQCYHRILDLKYDHLDIQVLQILANAIINDINDAIGNPTSRLLQKSLELFGRLSCKNCACKSDIFWRIYVQLIALDKTSEGMNINKEKIIQYLKRAHLIATSDLHWFHSEDKTLNVLELSCELAQTYLHYATVAGTDVDKRRILGSAKLALQGVVKEVKNQEWNHLDIIQQLTKVEQHLGIIINEFDQIKLV